MPVKQPDFGILQLALLMNRVIQILSGRHISFQFYCCLVISSISNQILKSRCSRIFIHKQQTQIFNILVAHVNCFNTYLVVIPYLVFLYYLFIIILQVPSGKSSQIMLLTDPHLNFYSEGRFTMPVSTMVYELKLLSCFQTLYYFLFNIVLVIHFLLCTNFDFMVCSHFLTLLLFF